MPLDPELCFEVPFCIPFDKKNAMTIRLADIHLIMKGARERQSISCAEHRRKLSARPSQYREKAKAIMNGGQLRRLDGSLNEFYFDYLYFRHESSKDVSPLTIQVSSLCPPLSPPLPCLFGPSRQGDLNEFIKHDLSCSKLAAPTQARRQDRFTPERRRELGFKRRIQSDYSGEERKIDSAALESQQRFFGACPRTEARSPPLLERKCPVPLPVITPSSPSSNTPPCDEGAHLKCEGMTDCGLLMVDGA